MSDWHPVVRRIPAGLLLIFIIAEMAPFFSKLFYQICSILHIHFSLQTENLLRNFIDSVSCSYTMPAIFFKKFLPNMFYT